MSEVRRRFPAKAIAEAFLEGVEYVNDSAIEVVGVHPVDGSEEFEAVLMDSAAEDEPELSEAAAENTTKDQDPAPGAVFEIVVQGFSGGTDHTDDHVLWIAAPVAVEEREKAFSELRKAGLAHIGMRARPLPEVAASSPDVDFTLPAQTAQFAARVLEIIGQRERSGESDFDDLIAEAGWNEKSQVVLLRQYLMEQRMFADFARFAKAIAAEEEAASRRLLS